MFVYVWACMYLGKHVKVRGQSVGGSSLLSPWGLPGLTQVRRLGGKHLYSLNYLSCQPIKRFLLSLHGVLPSASKRMEGFSSSLCWRSKCALICACWVILATLCTTVEKLSLCYWILFAGILMSICTKFSLRILEFCVFRVCVFVCARALTFVWFLNQKNANLIECFRNNSLQCGFGRK